MAAPDLLNDLLSSDPNEPATKGVVLLLRAEMKSEFKAVRSDLELVKQDVAVLKQDVAELKQDVAELKQDVAMIKTDIAGMKSAIDLVARQVATLVARA